MKRPGIVRADTIDLQDRDAPSAKDHSHVKAPANTQNASSSISTNNILQLASHQAQTLRGVAAETAQDRRISWTGSNLSDLHIYNSDLAADIADTLDLSRSLHESMIETGDMSSHQQQDALAVAQNGGLSTDANDGDMEDIDDEELEDDMMDKISSSPSIEDGGYPQNSKPPPVPPPLAIVRPDACDASQPATNSTETAHNGGSPPDVCQCDLARPPHLFSDRPLEPVSANTSPLLVSGDSQACKAPDVLPDESPLHQHRRRHGRYDSADLETTAINAEPGGAKPDSPETRDHETDSFDDADTFFDLSEALAVSATGMGLTTIDKQWGVSEDLFDEMMVPYYNDEDDDDLDDGDGAGGGTAVPYRRDIESRFVLSGWSSECLHNIEDIDFEFVYALHTFMATVEGQANATKGDTMVLLDDSNSYWWLVRVVKDSSIGYLPAEHIETPTERLARLNKHRNIDLSAAMLGDQAEKTKNPLKSAMRRRKTKNVSFAPPTFVDYSDIDYSTEEEDLEAEYFAQQQQAQRQQQEEHKAEAQANAQQDQQAGAMNGKDAVEEEDKTANVEPLKPRAKENGKAAADAKTDDGNDDGAAGKGGLTRTSEEIFVVSKSETPGPKKTKDGTVRDSFFKDDTVETKKITLTPNLLRDDSAPRTSSESKDVKQHPSLDRLDKDINSLLVKDDKKKKDKKEKDKKQGGFRSLFSRKDKKRGENDDDESFGKRSMDIGSESTERDLDDLEEEPAQEKETSPSSATGPQGPQRQPSKLQKQHPLGRIAEVSPTMKASDGSTRPKGTSNGSTMRMVDAEGAQDSGGSSQESSPKEASPFSTAHKSASSAVAGSAPAESSRPQMVIKAPARAVLDEFDSDEEGGVPAPQRQAPVPEEEQRRPHPNQGQSSRPGGDRLSESPVQISPVNANNPPALMVDTSSQEEEEEDRSSPMSPSPELVGSEDRSGSNHHAQDSITTSTSATTANTATWNDASLRAFFDSGTDVRDLLAVVYDKNDVVRVGPDHPVVSTMFKEQNAKLAEITTQLDNMLGDWLARKQRLRGTV